MGVADLAEVVAALPLKSLQEVRDGWLNLLEESPVNTIFLLPQWQEIWWESFGSDHELTGFYLLNVDGLHAIASLARSSITTFTGNTETFDYNDFIVRPGREHEFYSGLIQWLGFEGVEVLELSSLIEGSPTLEILPDLARENGYTVEILQEDVTPGLQLPGTWDEYLAGLSKKNRHELRRKLRRLEGVEGWRWYCEQAPDQVSARLDDFLTLMRQSDPEKAAYMNAEREAFFRRITQRTAELDLLRLYFLEMDGKDVAASLCFDYNGVRYLYNSGYNPDYGYYSVGLLLNALCLREAIEQGKTYFDFLRGPEAYKYHLGGIDRTIYSMMVTKP